jgi:hypothetical protein
MTNLSLPEDTLSKALEALIAIENGNLPSVNGVEALQQAVWAWMHPDRDRSTVAKALFRQGSRLGRTVRDNGTTLAAQVEIQRKMDAGSSKSKAVEDYGHEISSDHSKAPERQVYRRTKDMNSPDKLRRLAGAFDAAKDALKQKK